LRLAGAWLEPLIKMSPALRDGPLFGRRIAEVVEAVITESADDAPTQARRRRRDTVQAAPARAAPVTRPDRSRQGNRSTADSVAARTTPAAPRNKAERRRPRNQPGIGDSTRRSFSDPRESEAESGQARQTRAAEVAELPQRAGRELLEIRANPQQQIRRGNVESRSPAGAPTPRSSLAAPSKRAGDAPAPAKHKADQLGGTAPFQTRQSRVSTKRRGVFNEISQRRVGLRPGEPAGETFSQRLVRRTGNTIRGLRPSIDGAPQASESLADQWSTPLAGTAVPGDWLREVATGATGAISVTRSKGAPKHSSTAGPHYQTSTLPSPKEKSVTRVNRLDEYSPWSGEWPQTPMSLGGALGDSVGDQGEDAANRGRLERIAPPSLAESLPALSRSTPLQPAVTRILPLASESARQGALEEARPSEDLDALAAKIKFILDEQARRHGIDV